MATLSLEDTMVGVGLFSIAVIVALSATSGTNQPYGTTQSLEVISTRISLAQQFAAGQPNGATLTFTPTTGGRTIIALHAGRPTPTSTMAAYVENGSVTIDSTVSMSSDAGSSNGASFAVFFPQGGGASAAVWTPADGTLADEPACVNPIVLTTNSAGALQTTKIPCAGATAAPLPNFAGSGS